MPVTWPARCTGRGTTQFSIGANFDDAATVPTLAWDSSDPKNTSNFSTTIALFTRDGNALSVDVYFRKEDERVVTYYVLLDNPEGRLGRAELGSGRLEFDEAGALKSVDELQPVHLPEPDGLEHDVKPCFGTPLDEGGSGSDGMTSVLGPSNVWHQAQDGRATLTGYDCLALGR